MKIRFLLLLIVFMTTNVAAKFENELDQPNFTNKNRTCDFNSCTGVITRFLVHGSQNAVYLELEGDMSLLNCTLNGGSYVLLDESIPKYQEMYSFLFEVFMKRKKVTVRMVENSPNCSIAYVVAFDIF